MPDPTAADELLDDTLGTLRVEVKLAGGPHAAEVDVLEAYTRYCDQVGEATADGRDAAVRAWASAELGAPVSGLTAARLSHLVVDRVQRAAKKPPTAGSTGSTSPDSPAPPPAAS